MSDTIARIIPLDSYKILTDYEIEVLVHQLQYKMQDTINYINYKSIQFIDCGTNLDHIYCPICNQEIQGNEWGVMMDKAWSGQSFTNLQCITSCCERQTSLASLRYDMPCGFATYIIEILNPKDQKLEEYVSIINHKVIYAHI